MRAFYQELYGVDTLDASAQRVAATVAAQPPENAVVVLAHNGRAGLGPGRRDICGVDWKKSAGAEANGMVCIIPSVHCNTSSSSCMPASWQKVAVHDATCLCR